MTSTHYVDANLHHDLLTGKAVTAILHMLHATPVHWHCKRLLTVGTATFGSEFVAARTAVNQIIDTHLTLMYLGVPINPKSSMFGDSKAVVTNTTILLPLSPRHPIFLVISESEKDLQQDMSSSIGKMENLILQTSLANIGDSPLSGLFYNPFFWIGDPYDLATKSKGSDRIPINMPINDGSWVDLEPFHAVEKGVPKGSPKG